MKQKLRTEICPYANGMNLELTRGHCHLTKTRCYDITCYSDCYFYKKEVKDETKKN